MAYIIYDFISNILIDVGGFTEGTAANVAMRQFSTILTIVSIFLIFYALVKFVIWMFKAPFRRMKWRD